MSKLNVGVVEKGKKGVPLTPQREQAVLRWWAQKARPTFAECYRDTGVSPSAICRLLARNGIEWSHENVRADFRDRQATVAEWRTVLARLHAQAYAGLYVDPVIATRFPCKMLFAPDSHGNYWDSSVTEEMLRRDGDATLVVTNEIITADAFSHFRQEYDVDTMSEFLVTGAFIEMLKGGNLEGADRRQVVISNSNHQERFLKFVADNAKTPDAVKTSAELWAAGMQVYAGIKPELSQSFVVQVGRALFGHPDSYMASQGGTATRLLQRCSARYPEFGLQPPFQFVAIGHPHRLNLNQALGSRAFVAEAGCQCYVPRYAVRDNTTRPCTTYPMVNAYVSVTFDRIGNVESFCPVFVKYATMPGRSES